MRRVWLLDIGVAVVYVLLTVLMTWPVVLQLDTHFIGQSKDVWLNPWVTWWTEQALSTGQSLYHTDRLFYPQGVSLAFHSFSHVNTVLAVLLRPWFGNLGAHNVTMLLAHALSGYAMFCLVRYLTHSSIGAFFAGLVFAFFPYLMSESVHPVIVSTQWIPFYFLFLLRLLREKHRRFAVPAALFFILTALSSWHLMLFTAFLSTAYLCYLFFFERHLWSKVIMRNLLLLALLAGIALIPLVYPLIREQLTTPNSYVGVDLDVGRGNDLVAFLLPPDEHPVWGKLIESAHETIDDKHDAYAGILVIGLSIVGCLKRWQQARFWLLFTSATILFSIGPYLVINGQTTGILIPWSIPVVWLFRHPFRLNVLLGFGLAVTSGLGLSALLRWLDGKRPKWLWPVAGALIALLLFEYWYFPFPTTSATIPDFYLHLSAASGQGAILDLPMGRQPSKRYMYYQTVHGRPLLEGHVSRTPSTAYTFIETNPLLRSFLACEDIALPPVILSQDLGTLSEAGVEYIVLHKNLAEQISLDTWMDERVISPAYEDETTAVYDIRALSMPPARQTQLLGSCIAVRPLLTSTVPITQGETIDVPIEWIVGNSPKEALVLELALVDAAGQTRQRHTYEVSDGLIADWSTGFRKTKSYSFQIPPLISPGTYRLRAALVPVEREEEIVLWATLQDVQVMARPRDFVLPAVQHALNVVYGHDLRLLGYDFQKDAAAIHLTLHWQALRRMDVMYKFFVHLYDAENGTLVAQADVVPHGWTYPNTWWEAGEVVSDRVVLSLEGVPAGTYGLAVGIYDAETGERLTISGQATDFIVEESRLILPEKVTR